LKIVLQNTFENYGQKHLDNPSAPVNKLVPCAWLSSGALEVWSLLIMNRRRISTQFEETGNAQR